MVDSHFNQTMATEEDIPFVSSSSPSKVSFSPCEWVNGLMIVILCSNWRRGAEAEEDQHIHRSSLLLFCLVISPLYCTELREHRLLARQSFATWRREAMDWKCCFWRREGRRGQEHKRNSVGREACEWFHTTYHLPTCPVFSGGWLQLVRLKAEKRRYAEEYVPCPASSSSGSRTRVNVRFPPLNICKKTGRQWSQAVCLVRICLFSSASSLLLLLGRSLLII